MLRLVLTGEPLGVTDAGVHAVFKAGVENVIGKLKPLMGVTVKDIGSEACPGYRVCVAVAGSSIVQRKPRGVTIVTV